MIEVDFSKDGTGKVLLGIKDNSLEIFKCNNKDVSIGDNLPRGTKDTGELLVKLNFYKEESITSLIKYLSYIKANMQEELDFTKGC